MSVVAAPIVEPGDPTTGWSLRRRLGQLFLALTLVIGILVALIAILATRFVLAGNAVVYRWQPALLASQEVLGDLVNQETGVRGYVLTQQRASLHLYLENRTTQQTDTARLEHLVGGDTQIQVRLQRFEAAAAAWQHHYAGPVVAEIRQDKPATTDRSAAGRTRFNHIRTAAADLNDAIGRRAGDARHDRVVSGVLAGIAIAIGILLVTAAGLLLWRGLHRWVLRPVDDLAGQTRAVASGDLARVIGPGGPNELLELGADVEAMRAQIVTELARAERISGELRRKGDELERSNGDLQQFAYVASHDLSEPLRKVANFCQLLDRQYGPQLDDRARQYIDFAVDGAKRMQALINDLLALSRVGRTTESFVPVDLGVALSQAESTLSERILAAGATIERATELPVVAGDRSLLTSLIENLVGNAVKYHRDDVAPVVTVAARPLTDQPGWSISVSDNGIGIDVQYAERIFAVFQRLHLRDQYGGTGIGLALCRRIVDFHGGQIRLETDPAASGSSGATFTFTLPEGNPRAELLR